LPAPFSSRRLGGSKHPCLLAVDVNRREMPGVSTKPADKRPALIKPSLLWRSPATLQWASPFAFLATHISALGIVTLISYSDAPDAVMLMFVGTCTLGFGIGATLT
jgi:hypothetical protein